MNFRALTNHPAFALGSLAVGALGVALSVYFYSTSRSAREPVFLVDQTRARILDQQAIGETPIKVLREDGTEITDDLTIATVFFWNAGKESIRRQNVLTPLRIVFDQPNVRILHAAPVKVSRPHVTQFQLSHDLQEVKFNFSILERSDGASIQITYEGAPGARLQLEGNIEGVTSIDTVVIQVSGSSSSRYFYTLVFFVVVFLPYSVYLAFDLLRTKPGKRVWDRLLTATTLTASLAAVANAAMLLMAWPSAVPSSLLGN